MRDPRAANLTFEGERALIFLPRSLLVTGTQEKQTMQRIRATYPNLKLSLIEYKSVPGDIHKCDLDEEVDWSDVTCLFTLSVFPEPEKAPRLRFIQLFSAGTELAMNQPIIAAAREGKRVLNLASANGVHAAKMSEWVIMTYLALEQRLPKFIDNMKTGTWDRTDLILSPPEESSEKVIGILGYGAIGRHVARIAVSMGMTVHAYTARARPTPESRYDESLQDPGLGDPEGVLPKRWFSGSDKTSLHEFLASGIDLLVVTVPGTSGTRDMISTDELAVLHRAKPGRTILSNVARGHVVNSAALLEALSQKWIRAAALDVTDPEPLPADHPLWRRGVEHGDVIITPHVSAMSDRLMDRAFRLFEINMERVASGETPMNDVDLARGY